MPITKIISGGQTGVDRAALDVGLELGVEIGGWCPKGRLAEDGPIDAKYPLIETPSSNYPQRTVWNVRDSDGTLFLINGEIGRGTRLAMRFCQEYEKPTRILPLGKTCEISIEAVTSWIEFFKIKTLNVAGPRESKSPGNIYRLAREVLKKILNNASNLLLSSQPSK